MSDLTAEIDALVSHPDWVSWGSGSSARPGLRHEPLVAEIVALDEWDRTPEQTTRLGTVTTGKLWEFALLYRQAKTIEHGIGIYRVPEDIEPLMRILVQALNGET